MNRLVVISPAPTANGDLHLGHLAGPFLAADVCARYARATGREALYGTGMHFTQNYIVTAAARLGVAPEELRERSADQVQRTLATMGIEVDGFGCIGDRFTELVMDFYDRLHGMGALELRTVRFPYLPSTGEYLMDAYVTGGCPFCLADGYAGVCESCGLPVAPGDLIEPRSTLRPDEPLEYREADILVFPVERYRADLEAYFARIPMRPGMAQLIESALAGPLPDFPITQPTSWGIPAPFPEVPGQVIYPHMEGMPWSMFTTALAAEKRGAILTSDDELWHADSGSTVVYFLGLDATYPFAIVGTAMLTALGGHVLPAQYVTNEFYELANEKFSTSRGHVVSGRDLAAEVPRDLIRFHLCATSPEYQRTDFTHEALLRVSETRLTGPWNRVAAAIDAWVDRGPLPVSEDARRTALRMAERFADGYELRRFSLTAVASTLAEQLGRLDRLAAATTAATAGDLCHQVDVFLRCAAPILIDLAAAALPDTTLPGQVDADAVIPKKLPRLAG
ncbi:class I tRNA ligase family protein [Amycolatopsis azurea]|uniref:Methionine--tRNA ligase n=1 Tax=Amycolatopsis azurea DSM 43854 TaxID=1238180 RepID=M2QIR0_9PSEU|nr:class I tRNA ligase family protein [Amycolatopsis azurea]EMD26591.1 Methionyl-tRNA synthetase-related protein [Amycolatopsis azurea DSM 43854]OOC05713.1 methionine--tRNA ligase [Amycolatopsis azurea DSM 43854]